MNLQNKTQCVGFFARNYKTKHNIDNAVPFATSQKSQHKFIISKSLFGLETFPNNY